MDHPNMPVLTKFILNKKIVEMRKPVRQARIHCISKLCKEIRRLKDKKGSEEQVSKSLRKADKLIQLMFIIKKIKPDIVSKFALQNEKSMIEITNDVNESLEKKALSRFANHKSLNEQVIEFRKTFPDWKKSLEPLLETLGEKYRNIKSNKPISRKQSKRKPLDSMSEISKGTQNRPRPSQISTINNSSGMWTVENYCASECSSHESKRSMERPEEVSNLEEVSKKNRSQEQNSAENASNTKICRTEKLERLTTRNIPITSSESQNISNFDSPKITADPFFVTKDNKEYLSVSAPHINSEEKSCVDPVLEREKDWSKSKRFGSKNKLFNPKFKQKNGLIPKANFSKVKDFNLSYSKFNSVEDETDLTSIHPSWEAKKKLSTIIQNSQFQGKKIKFDD